MQWERPKLNLQFTVWALRFFQHETQIIQTLQHNGQDSAPRQFLAMVVKDVTVDMAVETVVVDQVDLVIGTMTMMRTAAVVPLMSQSSHHSRMESQTK